MQLGTVLLLFEFLPVPVNLNVFLVRGDHLVLNFVGPVLFVFIFFLPAFVFSVVDVVLDPSDGFVRLEPHLDETTFSIRVEQDLPLA